MTSVRTTHQSRWGFHPCNHEFFLKLKALHRWYWETLYAFHRWHRWQRKDVKNRSGAEPRYFPEFVLSRKWYKPVHRRGVEGYKVYPKTVTDHGVLDLYHQARTPQSDPVQPLDADVTAMIEALHAKAAVYFGE